MLRIFSEGRFKKMDCTGIELKVNTNADKMNGFVDIAKTSIRNNHAVVINHFHGVTECTSCPNCQGKKVVVAKDDFFVTSVAQAVTVATLLIWGLGSFEYFSNSNK